MRFITITAILALLALLAGCQKDIKEVRGPAASPATRAAAENSRA